MSDSLVISALIIVVLGFILGQTLHSAAVALSAQSYRLFSHLHNRYELVQDEYRDDKKNSIQWYLESNGIDDGIYAFSMRKLSYVWSLPSGIYIWLIKRLREVFVPHRLFFKYWIKENFAKDDLGGLHDWFKIQSRDILRSEDFDIVADYEDVYRFVMSYLAITGGGRARKFQATASFCRGMWITLFMFSIVYLYIGISGFRYTTVIGPVLDMYTFWIPAVLFVTSLFFMYSSGKQKRHFVEYIPVDFYNLYGNKADDTGVNIDLEDTEFKINHSLRDDL